MSFVAGSSSSSSASPTRVPAGGVQPHAAEPWLVRERLVLDREDDAREALAERVRRAGSRSPSRAPLAQDRSVARIDDQAAVAADRRAADARVRVASSVHARRPARVTITTHDAGVVDRANAARLRSRDRAVARGAACRRGRSPRGAHG